MTPERVLLKKRPRELKSAFDVSSYGGLEGPEVRKRLLEDLPSYVIEQGDLPWREKTTSGVWYVKDGEVIHPTLGPVINYISQKTLRDRQEYVSFLKIRDYLVKGEGNPIVCWFSPTTSVDIEKENYTESRIVVYFIEEKNDEGKRVRYYEFAGDHSFEQQRQIANQFRAYSQEEYYFPSLEKLRETPILLEGIELEKVVEEVATYPEVWEDITSGRVGAKMKKVSEAALEVAEGTVVRILNQENPILVGAAVEQEMAKRISWNISHLGGCGFSNSFILAAMGVESFSNYQNHYFLTLQAGENKVSVLSFKEEKKFSGECPVCHKIIPRDQAISPGERCPFCHTKWECY